MAQVGINLLKAVYRRMQPVRDEAGKIATKTINGVEVPLNGAKPTVMEQAVLRALGSVPSTGLKAGESISELYRNCMVTVHRLEYTYAYVFEKVVKRRDGRIFKSRYVYDYDKASVPKPVKIEDIGTNHDITYTFKGGYVKVDGNYGNCKIGGDICQNITSSIPGFDNLPKTKMANLTLDGLGLGMESSSKLLDSLTGKKDRFTDVASIYYKLGKQTQIAKTQ